MGHSAHSDDHHHDADEKSVRFMVLFTLALFFAMTCVGNYIFVASAHHEAPTTSHSTHSVSHDQKTDDAHTEESGQH